MNSKFLTLLLVAGVILCAGTPSTFAGDKSDKEQTKLEAKAKISRVEAEKTALAKVPGGTVKEAELEKENGKLVWSFDIATADSKDITEVQVDAKTGKIVSVEKETPEEQAKEKAADKKNKEKK